MTFDGPSLRGYCISMMMNDLIALLQAMWGLSTHLLAEALCSVFESRSSFGCELSGAEYELKGELLVAAAAPLSESSID